MQAIDYVNIKLAKTAGITQALELADLSKSYGVKCMIGCMLEGPISVAAGVHVASAKADIITMLDLDAVSLLASHPITTSIQFDESTITLSDEVGLGVAVLNTLEELKSGSLHGALRVKLACGLETFPEELFDLAETLEVLDLTDNKLTSLPKNFGLFKKLKILFLSNNNFKEVPTVLAQCPNLSMIGIRNNQISIFKENALPLSTRWLILTDNELKTLPNSMGDLTLLQKCMLSGNKLTALPQSMSKCHNLELLRIAVNQLTELPIWLLTLPKLSWLAYSGNPFCAKHPNCDTALKEISWETLEIKEVLGEGASGLISKALFEGKEVAVKVFKGDITSDGLPEEEMDINISMGHHDHLVDVLARVTGHPEGKDVLMLELIPSHFFNLRSYLLHFKLALVMFTQKILRSLFLMHLKFSKAWQQQLYTCMNVASCMETSMHITL